MADGLYGGLWKSASQGAKDALSSHPNVANMGNEERRSFLQNYATSSAAQQGAGGAGGGGGTTAAGYQGSSTEALGGYGEELMDPNSEYNKLRQAKLTGEIGADTEAQRRLASFDAAQSGMGAGGSPELSATLGDIGIAGGEATGRGMVDLISGGTQLGLGALGQAQQGELGYAGMDLERDLASQRDKLARWQTGIGQQEAQQQREMESWYQNRSFGLQEQQAAEEAKWREFTQSQDIYGGGGGYGGGYGGEYIPQPEPTSGGGFGRIGSGY